MDSQQEQKQPAPVLAWHREAAICIMGLNYPPGDAVTNIAHIIAVHHWSHDPHAETVRLLEEAFTVVSNLGSTLAMMSSPDTRWESPMMTQYREHRDAIRSHLAKLKGTQ